MDATQRDPFVKQAANDKVSLSIRNGQCMHIKKIEDDADKAKKVVNAAILEIVRNSYTNNSI